MKYPIDKYVAKARENFDTLFEAFKTYSANGCRVGKPFNALATLLAAIEILEEAGG
jgi:hypothetical protein